MSEVIKVTYVSKRKLKKLAKHLCIDPEIMNQCDLEVRVTYLLSINHLEFNSYDVEFLCKYAQGKSTDEYVWAETLRRNEQTLLEMDDGLGEMP